MPEQFEFATVGRLPAPGDNVAIATRRLEAGTEIAYADSLITSGLHRDGGTPLRRGRNPAWCTAPVVGAAVWRGSRADRAGRVCP